MFVRGITNKFDRRMTILALDLLLEMRAVSPGMLAIAGGLLVWNLGIRGGAASQPTHYLQCVLWRTSLPEESS